MVGVMTSVMVDLMNVMVIGCNGGFNEFGATILMILYTTHLYLIDDRTRCSWICYD